MVGSIAEGSERPGVPLVVIDYDPAWPHTYARWRHRVGAAVGTAALRIEHVGSTSVPGLVAKPIVDIQVSVADLGDEQRYVPQLERSGLVLRSRDEQHRYFRPPAGQPREVHVRVCAAGSQWERDHLLFRDYLRAGPAACHRRPRATAFGADAYPDLDAKAAALLHSLARDHALADGNKRLALAGVLAFYGVNGRRLTLTKDGATISSSR